MNKYIGCKLVSAEPAFRVHGKVHNMKLFGVLCEKDKEQAEIGYSIEYPDGYVSWSPKDVFEKAYMKLDNNKELPSGVSIGEKMVDEFISHTETFTMGNRTTVVRCVLRNGFVIVESSSCVDPANYSQEMGEEICMGKIKDKIWELLGFMLQSAANGVNN